MDSNGLQCPVQVDAVACALVREYLHGKGYQETLNCIDAEMSKSNKNFKKDVVINSRTILAKTLHIEKLLKRNKQEAKPCKTMIEIISKYFLTRAKITDVRTERDLIKSIDIDFNEKDKKLDRSVETNSNNQLKNIVSTPIAVEQTEKSNSKRQNTLTTIIPLLSKEISNYDSKNEDEVEDLAKNVDSTVAVEDLKPFSHSDGRYLNRNGDDLTIDLTKPMKSRRNLEPVEADDAELSMPNNVQVPSIRQTSKPLNVQSRSLFLGGPITVGGLQNRKSRRTQLPQSKVEGSGQLGSLPVFNDGGNGRRELTATIGVREEESSIDDITTKAIVSGASCDDNDIESVSMGNWLINKTASPVQALTTTTEMKPTGTSSVCVADKFADIEVNDLDDLEESSSGLMVSADPAHVWLTLPQGKPIDASTAIDLKTLLLGSYKKDFSEEWKVQNFGLNKNNVVSYGLVQKKGGPCGVLACVQAYLLKKLFFTKSKNKVAKSDFSKEEVKKCLALALAHILWMVGNKRTAIVAFPSSRQSFTDERPGLCDGFIEKINLMHFTDLSALQSFLNRYVGWYTDDTRYSCIAFLYSVILSKGIENVRKDMDDPNTCLIGVHSYCSQEIVNLMLTGHASSNVFDNTVVLEEGTETQSMFKGVMKRSDIGFLALFEHYNSCQVGENLKCPRYPIWVVCSESHFSILFLKDPAVVGKSFENLLNFDLYYYDGLLQQDYEIRLTIDMTGERIPTKYCKDLVPPLELCIRTKWTGAVVDWNDTDPLL